MIEIEDGYHPLLARPIANSISLRGRSALVTGSNMTGKTTFIKLLTRQVRGSSSGPLPGWRWMETDQISDAEMLDQTFPGGRPTPSGKHHRWDILFIRVKPPKKKPD